MKRRNCSCIKRGLSLVLVAILGLALVACGSKGLKNHRVNLEPSPIAGMYMCRNFILWTSERKPVSIG